MVGTFDEDKEPLLLTRDELLQYHRLLKHLDECWFFLPSLWYQFRIKRLVSKGKKRSEEAE
ncbi:hypothetical protein IMZ31_22605 (plasmid) [Pontibacillus sp. ALD_SL1]|uniref:hypothetical protein n=1 Tax=Pontibacillus sp. ALD_SL1 TaxID=2777185 RepID=UPI001A96569F|nr:hypothetical protein [Pontibacillus sp. ALD_SL1]QST02248.1 hypothetical protein IMZ31_22605 [Pontibacillus sp. ALD_SL1]